MRLLLGLSRVRKVGHHCSDLVGRATFARRNQDAHFHHRIIDRFAATLDDIAISIAYRSIDIDGDLAIAELFEVTPDSRPGSVRLYAMSRRMPQSFRFHRLFPRVNELQPMVRSQDKVRKPMYSLSRSNSQTFTDGARQHGMGGPAEDFNASLHDHPRSLDVEAKACLT